MIKVEIKKKELDKIINFKLDAIQLAREVVPIWKLKIDKETKKTTRSKLKRRTGNLARSFIVAPQRFSNMGSNKMLVDFELNVAYGDIQDKGTKSKGGTYEDITPKNSKWLTIPNSKNKSVMTGAGVLKKYAREIKGLHFVKKNEDKAFLFKNNQLYFTLVKKVALKPTRWFSDAVDNSMGAFDKILSMKIKEKLK